LPEAFGSWNSICKRFNACSLSSKWLRVFKALSIDPDCEWEFIDGSYVKPAEFEITSGEVNDCSMVPDLIAKLPDAKAIVAEEKF